MELKGELKGELQFLIDKAWAFHDGLTDEIKNNNSFCNFCSENGRFCKISRPSFQEMERLIAIRDSLKQVQDQLILLQRLRSWQLVDRNAALNRIEERRITLMEKLKEYKGSSSVDIVKDLNACFNNAKTVFGWSLNGKIKKRADPYKENKRENGFVIWCITMLSKPWKWQKVNGVAAKLVVISASIWSTVRICSTSSLRYRNSQRKIVSPNSSLDIFYGRG